MSSAHGLASRSSLICRISGAMYARVPGSKLYIFGTYQTNSINASNKSLHEVASTMQYAVGI